VKAQVPREVVPDPAAEHDEPVEVGAGEQPRLVVGEVEVLQAQAGERVR
jgi:hypothetical protein